MGHYASEMGDMEEGFRARMETDRKIREEDEERALLAKEFMRRCILETPGKELDFDDILDRYEEVHGFFPRRQVRRMAERFSHDMSRAALRLLDDGDIVRTPAMKFKARLERES